jgi:hypothetical protein
MTLGVNPSERADGARRRVTMSGDNTTGRT